MRWPKMLLTQCDFAQCSECQRGEKFKQALTNGPFSHYPFDAHQNAFAAGRVPMGILSLRLARARSAGAHVVLVDCTSAVT